jgi:peptide/nickel transport system ATP-binding protein
LILRPKLVVADESVSALDNSVGAQVFLLLLQSEFGMMYIFISHSLPVVAQAATRISRGHPYTRQLLAVMPALPNG